jgi:predicted RNA methylase
MAKTRDYIQKKAKEWNAEFEVIGEELEFPLPKTYKFHKKGNFLVNDLLRVQEWHLYFLY